MRFHWTTVPMVQETNDAAKNKAVTLIPQKKSNPEIDVLW